MTRVSDLPAYQSQWLSAADLGGRARRLVIEGWQLQEVQERDGSKVRKVAVSFKGARKRLLCNRTQGQALEAAFGECERWPGQTVILQPARAGNGKDTIEIIVPPAAQTATEAPGEAQAPAGDESSMPEPPASAQPQQQAPAATASAPGAPAAGGMTDEEVAELWRKTPRKGAAEPWPGYSG